jgi:ribulose-5-phosphate 4-epimerase/fuculose-1-phosphate aldolase
MEKIKRGFPLLGFKMNGVKNLMFQTFYVSKEETNCPLAIEIIKLGNKLKQSGILKKEDDAVFSIGFGKRIIINSMIEDFSKIKREELLEVVDFDPIKNNLLLIGFAKPRVETFLHWMIHHARDDVSFIVQIKKTDFNKIKDVDVTDKYPVGSIDNTKDVLKALRNSKKVVIKNNGLLFVGRNIFEVEKQIKEFLGE